jgi:hypothetical protein
MILDGFQSSQIGAAGFRMSHPSTVSSEIYLEPIASGDFSWRYIVVNADAGFHRDSCFVMVVNGC